MRGVIYLLVRPPPNPTDKECGTKHRQRYDVEVAVSLRQSELKYRGGKFAFNARVRRAVPPDDEELEHDGGDEPEREAEAELLSIVAKLWIDITHTTHTMRVGRSRDQRGDQKLRL